MGGSPKDEESQEGEKGESMTREEGCASHPNTEHHLEVEARVEVTAACSKEGANIGRLHNLQV